MRYRAIIIVLILAAAVHAPLALAFDDIEEQRFCSHCGMDRKAFGFSRMVIQYDDGTRSGVCSVHCAVTELERAKGRPVRTLLVADRDTRTLIDATQAFWVAGGKKRGVMTDKPSWAFATKAAAEKFIKENGGTPAVWTDVLAAAKEEAGLERP